MKVRYQADADLNLVILVAAHPVRIGRRTTSAFAE